MKARPDQTGRERWIALLAAHEEPLIRSSAEALGSDLHVVRTRAEFERASKHGALCIVGDEQPLADRISTIRQARQAVATRPIVAVTDDSSLGIELLEAGADAVVRTDESSADAARKIRSAREGRPELDPDQQQELLVRLRHLSQLCVDQGVDVERCALLSPREREIVELLARRATNAQIAGELDIALGTVKNHVHKILAKLDVESRGLAGVYWRVFRDRVGASRARRDGERPYLRPPHGCP